MKIRWKGAPVLGTWHSDPSGIKTGEIRDVEEFHAKRYVQHDLAELVGADKESAHF
jgi:hypothetical protein